MSAADDNTTRPPLISGSTWFQLYRGDQAVGSSIKIVAATRNVSHLILTELVKEKELLRFSTATLQSSLFSLMALHWMP
jgi:hypothetical protein